MTDRIVDIASDDVFLHARNGLMVIEVKGEEKDAIPFEELAAVVVSNRRAAFTQSVISELAKAGASLVTCDERYHPAAMLVPMVSHYLQAERFARQASLGMPQKKRWWQAIVRAKIAAQSRTLKRTRRMDYGLSEMIARVGSGDPKNIESQAARRYWTMIFGDGRFQRGDEKDGRNAMLNYGYAVLRAGAVRAICASGLHPSFGLHHHNKLNPFALGDDVMEPYRPAVDYAVARLADRRGEGLTPAVKRVLAEQVTGRYLAEGESRTMLDVLTRTAQGLAGAVMSGALGWKPVDWEFQD